MTVFLKDVQAIWWAGVQAVQPDPLISQWISLQSSPYPNPLYLLAVGKAASAMAHAVTRRVPVREGGLVVTKHGHGFSIPGCTVLEAGHPVPDKASLAAALAVKAFAQDRQTGDTVWVLISGGASSLLADLPSTISLTEWQAVTQTLLSSGADIHDINALRKAVGTLKGGKLLPLLQGCFVETLAISDVLGDVPGTIGSGLTVPPSTSDTQILQKVVSKIDKTLLHNILQVLQTALLTRQPYIPPAPFHIIGSAQKAVDAAVEQAKNLGYAVQVINPPLQGDVMQEAEQMARVLSKPVKRPTAYIWWGEPTVTLPARPGQGGRNQHLALAVVHAANDTSIQHPWHVLAAGTDGTDGPTTAAGGWVDNHTCLKARQHGITLSQALKEANAGAALQAMNQLFITGPTQTNVMDLIIGLVSP